MISEESFVRNGSASAGLVRDRSETDGKSHLAHQAIPGAIDLLSMLAISDEVKVVGELYRLGDLLQDVDTEAFTAAFYVHARFTSLITERNRERKMKHQT